MAIKIIRAMVAAIFSVALCLGQGGSPTAPSDPFFSTTVSQLSSLSVVTYSGKYISLTDGANACDITTGGGSFKVPIVSNGSTWSAYGCAGTSGGTTLYTLQGSVVSNIITLGANCGPGSAACPLYIGNGTQVLNTAPATGTPVSSYNSHTGTVYGCANPTGGIYLAVSGASLVTADITPSGLTLTSATFCTQGDAVLAVFSVTSGTAAPTSNPALVGFGNTNVVGGTNITCAPTSSAITCNVPTATTSNLGAVQPDGSTITISAGVISSIGGSGTTCVSTAGVGYQFPYGIVRATGGITTQIQSSNTSAVLFIAPCTFTFSKLVFQIDTASGTSCSGGTCGLIWGLYSAAGSLVASSTALVSGGSPNINTTGTVTATFSSPQTLNGGTAYFLSASSDSAVLALSAGNDSDGNAVVQTMMNSNSASRAGYLASSSTGHGSSIALPSSISGFTTTTNGFSNGPLIMLTQ